MLKFQFFQRKLCSCVALGISYSVVKLYFLHHVKAYFLHHSVIKKNTKPS